jgi:hypothetical protein
MPQQITQQQKLDELEILRRDLNNLIQDISRIEQAMFDLLNPEDPLN